MKLIIEHSKTKRKVDGALNICGKGVDLLWLAKVIRNKVKKNKNYYGWITIPAQRPDEQHSIANTPPTTWD